MVRSGLSPELKTAAARVIPNQIDCNPHQPRCRAALPTECRPVLVGLPEAILSQSFREVPIPNRREYKSKDLSTVLRDQPFKVLDLQRRVFHGHGNEPGRGCLLHAFV